MSTVKDIFVSLAADIIKDVGQTVIDRVRQHARTYLESDSERDAAIQKQLDDLYDACVAMAAAFESAAPQPKSETTEIIERDGTEATTKPYAHLNRERE